VLFQSSRLCEKDVSHPGEIEVQRHFNGASILKCDMDLYRESTRISKSVKADRDLLIYIAWQLGVATNQEIGQKFGLTYSAVSQRVRVIKI